MTELNQRIRNIPIPRRLQNLKISDEGFPVPWFVDYVMGKPDFRTMDARKLGPAIRYHKCWMCGETMGKYMTSVIGPMCMISRTISEPPSHLECLEGVPIPHSTKNASQREGFASRW